MMKSNSLRPRLLQAFTASGAPERAQGLRDRRIVVFGPQSFLAQIHLQRLVDAGANIVLLIDDQCRELTLHGIPVKSSAAFVAGAARVQDAVLIDFTAQAYAQVVCHQLGAVTGLERRDLLELLAAYDAAAVYETVPDNRRLTLARADDWLALADRLADDFSRETLYAVLLQRLEYDRSVLRHVNLWGRDEYFGTGAQSDTFVAGQREHFVDCGAHRGTVVQKLLAATSGRYASIHAFEPDVENYAALQWMTPSALANFHVHRCAVSDRNETLRFAQTGTMGSHVARDGNVEVKAVMLDDVVEKATFIKMDVEGYEPRALRGAARLLATQRPRLAIASYHFAQDLLEVAQVLDELAPGYVLRLRHHYSYYFDSIFYASPREDWSPLDSAT